MTMITLWCNYDGKTTSPMDFRLVESVGLVSLIFTENYIEILLAYLFVFLIDRVCDGVMGCLDFFGKECMESSEYNWANISETIIPQY